MTTLTETEIRALNEALDDEYRAFATYEQVLADFGEVQPFNNILGAEARHIQALCRLFDRYGLSMPENPWPGNVDSYASLQAACEAGVAAEIANAEIYQRLLQSTERSDILTVFRNLHDASQQRHLPAFQRCVQGSVNGGGHRGGGRHGRHRGSHE